MSLRNEKYSMKVVCCVCKIQYDAKPVTKPGMVSHGFCQKCYDIQLKKIKDALGLPKVAETA